MNQPDNKFLAGPAFTVDEHRRVDRRDLRRQIEHIVHRSTARHKMLRRRKPRHALPQQVQLPFALRHLAFAPLQRLQLLVHCSADMLEFLFQRRTLVISAKRFEFVAPAGSVAADQDASRRALCRAFSLAQVHLASETRTGITAHVPGERPAHRRIPLAIVVDVLFGDI